MVRPMTHTPSHPCSRQSPEIVRGRVTWAGVYVMDFGRHANGFLLFPSACACSKAGTALGRKCANE